MNKTRYAEVESILEAGDEGMYVATMGVRNSPMGAFHGMSVTVIGKDLTECVRRTNVILDAFDAQGHSS